MQEEVEELFVAWLEWSKHSKPHESLKTRCKLAADVFLGGLERALGGTHRGLECEESKEDKEFCGFGRQRVGGEVFWTKF